MKLTSSHGVLMAQIKISPASRKILMSIQKTFSLDYQYEQLKPEDFNHLDTKFYDRVAKGLYDLNFVELANYTYNFNNTNAQQTYPFIKNFISSEKTTYASISHIKLNIGIRLLAFLFRRGPFKVFAFSTFFKNGTHLVSSTKTNIPSFTKFKWIVSDQYPSNISVNDLYLNHQNKVKEIAKSENTTPLHINSKEEFFSLLRNENIDMNRYMKEIGWVTREYLYKSFPSKTVADQTFDEIQQLLKEQEINN